MVTCVICVSPDSASGGSQNIRQTDVGQGTKNVRYLVCYRVFEFFSFYFDFSVTNFTVYEAINREVISVRHVLRHMTAAAKEIINKITNKFFFFFASVQLSLLGSFLRRLSMKTTLL